MLNKEIIKKIEDFVSQKPRSIQEIAIHLGKNWRTIDRYIKEINENYGTIETRTFREGTRGALKIVFWSSPDNKTGSVFQEELEKEILAGRNKDDFSGFDIFQHISKESKTTQVKKGDDESDAGKLEEFEKILMSAQKQIIFFSGNLSFINFDDGKTNLFNVLEKIIKKGISIKVICRVDLDGKENVEKLLSLNHKHKKELIEIRHRQQPLRATIVDNRIVNIKEIKKPTGRSHELEKKLFIFYTIKDKEWVEWLARIFWRMFNRSVGAKQRLEAMQELGQEN